LLYLIDSGGPKKINLTGFLKKSHFAAEKIEF
jgi:hypothetical protein